MLAAFAVAVYELEDQIWFREVDAALQSRVTSLAHVVRDARRLAPPPPMEKMDWWDQAPPPPPREPGRPPGPPPPFRPDRSGARLRSELASRPDVAALFSDQTNFYFLTWSRADSVLLESANAPRYIAPPSPVERDSLSHVRTHGVYREIVHCMDSGECVLVGRSVADEIGGAARLAWILFAAGGVILLIGSGIGWWFTGRAIRPLEEISRTAAEISAGNLAARVPAANHENELGRLAAVLNSTFSRLEEAFARQQQFTTDAAHELRTPLAIMISEAQTTLARPRAGAEYKGSLEACLDTAQQLRRLTSTLLDFTRIGTDTASSDRPEVDLAVIVARCVRKLEPLALVRHVTIHTDLAEARVITIAERLHLVIANLLNNAISYNRVGGEVTVSTFLENTRAILRVADTGIGISPSDLPHIFDRFYRADKARSRADGHTGLGLAICKSILDAEGATIQVSSELNRGSVFTVYWTVNTTDSSVACAPCFATNRT